jgi:nitrogenase molybdenum-iron protein alpha/beta subunit
MFEDKSIADLIKMQSDITSELQRRILGDPSQTGETQRTQDAKVAVVLAIGSEGCTLSDIAKRIRLSEDATRGILSTMHEDAYVYLEQGAGHEPEYYLAPAGEKLKKHLTHKGAAA